MAKFSKKEAISFGWNTTNQNLGFFIKLVLLAFVLLGAIPAYISDSVSKSAPVLSFVVNIITWLLGIVVSLGMIRIALKFVDGKKAELSDLISGTSPQLMLRYVGASILFYIIVILGLIIFVIPGIYLAIKFNYFQYFLVDQNTGVLDAFRKSSEITKGIKIDLFLFGILLGLVTLAGALALLVGLLWAIPTSMLAAAYVFRKLQAQSA